MLPKLVLLLSIFLYQVIALDVLFTSTNYTATATANHIFTFSGIQQYIEAGSYITFTYNTAWDLTSTTGLDLTSDFCSTGCTLSPAGFVKSGQTITLNNLFPTTVTLLTYGIQYTLKNMVNPNRALTQSMTVYIYKSGGIFQAMATVSIITEPTQLSCTGVPTNKLLQAISDYTFTITPLITLPSTGYVVVTFPSKWSDSAEIDVYQPTFSCSNSLGSLPCTNPSSLTIRVPNVLSVSGSSAFTFNINGIRNPGSTGINQEVSLSFFNSNNEMMGRGNITISGLLQQTMTGVSFTMNCKTTQYAFGVLLLTIPSMVRLTDKMVLTFDPSITVTPLTKVLVYIGTDNVAYNTEISIQTLTMFQSSIAFYPFNNQVISYFRIELYNLRCSSTIKQTSNIQIDIYRMGSVVMTHQCCKQTSTLPDFETASVLFEDYRMAQVTNYNFVIKINQTLGLGTKFIDFIFPATYGLVTGNTYNCLIQMYTDPSKTLCTVISPTLMSLSLVSMNFSVLLSTLKGENVTSSLQLTITISGIKNPTATSVSFDIYLADISHNYLQGKTGISQTLTAAMISGVQITPASYMVNSKNTYTFRVNNTNALVGSSILRIRFPPQIKLASPVCKINGGVVSFVQSSVNSRDVLEITLLSVGVVQYGLFSSQVVSVDNVVNRDSFELSDSFELELESSGVVIEGVYNGLSVVMNQSSTFSSVTATRLNDTVYQKTEYTIAYTLPFGVDPLKTYKLRVIFPSQYRIWSCLGCSSFGEFVISSSSGTVKIDSVQNPYKTVISSAISYELRVNEYLSLQSSQVISFFSSIVQGFSVKFSNTVMGAPATYWVVINYVKPDMSELRIQLPAEVTIGSSYNVTCLQCQVSSFTRTSNLLKVFITKVEAENITIEVSNLTNPITSPSSIFTLSTYSSDSVLISQSTSVSNVFSISCSVNCATCDSLNPLKCLTCYQNPSISSLKYLRASSNICVSTCLSSQYLINLTCYQCNPNCNSCVNESHICLSCSGLYSLFNNRCILTCPQTYYSQSNICQGCVPPCLSCSDAITCTYCISGKLLRTDNTCQDTCLAGQYNKSNICTACPVNCTSCTGSGCTACTASNYLLNGNCLSSCPYGYYIDSTNLLCEPCNSPCKYCSINSTNCTGCDKTSLNSYYHLNQCIPSCPNTYYPDQNYLCRACTSPCLNCNSPTNCTSCQPSYFFYPLTNQCFLTCIANTIQVGSICVACQSPCLQCLNSVTYCTSCIENYFLDQTLHKCNATCNSPAVAINRLCSTCLSPCAACNPGQPYSCTSCIGGYNFLQNNCYQTCPSKTYANSGYCLPCTSGCYQCTTTSSTCTSCYPGTYLFGSSCIPSCPTSPILYYEYQSQCIACQLPCNTCLSTPVECATCKYSTDYWNPVTLKCLPSCQSPFYSVVISGTRQCKQCQLPCKICSTNYDKCSSCYNGKYLLNEQCIISCPARYYSSNNSCLSCPNLCATCTPSKCLTCDYGSYLYKELCYNSCPPDAPYSYGAYCRNCLKDNCLLCNKNNECIMCFQHFYLLSGNCLQNCPDNYEPDSTTGLACVKTSSSALFQFLQHKQKDKILLFSGSILMLFLIGSVLVFPGNNILGIYSLVSIPETVTSIIFAYFYFTNSVSDLTLNFTLPKFTVIIILALGCVISICYVVRVNKILMLDEGYRKCYEYGSNEKRTNLISIFSLLNFKIMKLSFSGYMKLPFTSYQLKNKQLLKYLNWVTIIWIIIFNIPLIFLSLYIIIVQKAYLASNKIFYSAADSLVVQLISSLFSLIYLFKPFSLPDPYKRFIIEGVSDLTLPPLSQPNDYIGNQEEDNVHLYHSNSVQDIKESQQMKDVQFLSVYDPSDFEDPPKVSSKQLQTALKKGKFRTKQKPKKRGKGKYKLDELEVINEEISDEEQKMNSKQRQFKNKNKKSSLVNNYIYWQPPKTKNRAEQVFKQNKKEIMQKIYQKQSEFDTITNNDIIFLEESDDEDNRARNSMDDNFDEEINSNLNESKRELKPIVAKNMYNDLLNLNYAQRKHLS